MEIKYHKTVKGILASEILPGSELIAGPDDILDYMADARFNGRTPASSAKPIRIPQ